jgi:hypothetical protein
VRVLYFDCVGGISGDMAIAALLAAGAGEDVVRAGIASLQVEPVELEVEETDTHGIAATRVHVRAQASGVIRTYANIRSLLDASDLAPAALELAQRIFRRLALAEAAVHRRDVEHVAFHEIGAVDSIVDIAGTAIALTSLGVERIFSSPVPTGVGMIKTEHGQMPLPAPAVVELLRGAPMYSRPVPMELVTPTGAAILAATVEGYGDLPMLRTEAVGYGAGTHRPDFPNVLRVLIGEGTGEVPGMPGSPPAEGSVTGELVLATNVDDLNPELHAFVLERLFEAGAQDAWLTPIVMKKGRPAMQVSALVSPARADAIREVLFRETGTLGVRTTPVEKAALERDWVLVRTRHGEVRVKIGLLDGRPITISPEYDDCARVAREARVPARDVVEEARRLARDEVAGRSPPEEGA